MKLRRLSDAEYDRVEKLAQANGKSLDQCPTCGASQIEVAPSVYGWINGTYKFRGEELDCDCATQRNLYRHYLSANVGEQYQRLDWVDYDGSLMVRNGVKKYLDHYKSAKQNGMGIEFAGQTLGTGKTFAATHIAKELIKQGENVYFIPFLSIMNLYTNAQDQELERHLMSVSFLCLDEIIPGNTGAQAGLFARRFEELIRHRTNFNLPVISTTNLTYNQLEHYYPRTYSLLEAKQMKIEVEGKDARMEKIPMENIELMCNDEVRPIT
jgi:DNA replication protein DnaC